MFKHFAIDCPLSSIIYLFMASETIDTQKMIYLPMENMASETIETQKKWFRNHSIEPEI